MGIAHGGAPALGPSSFYDQVPVPKTAGPARRSPPAPCRLSAGTLKLGPDLLAIPSLERLGAAGCLGVGGGISSAGPPRQTP